MPAEDERAIAAELPRLIELVAPHLQERYPLIQLPSGCSLGAILVG
jgi:hypothetical protein